MKISKKQFQKLVKEEVKRQFKHLKESLDAPKTYKEMTNFVLYLPEDEKQTVKELVLNGRTKEAAQMLLKWYPDELERWDWRVGDIHEFLDDTQIFAGITKEQLDFEDDLYDTEFIDDVEETGFDLEEEFQDLVMKYDRGFDDPVDKERAEDVMNRIFDLEPAMYDDFKKQYEMRWGSDEEDDLYEGQKAKKTEKSGAKHSKGAYYGRKKDAKKDSSKLRRKKDKEETGINEILDELDGNSY